jgi:hypothetical protein
MNAQFFPIDLDKARLPILLGAIFVWGLCGALLHTNWDRIDQALASVRGWLIVLIIGWGAYVLVKAALLDVTGKWLDNAIQYSDKLVLARDLAGAVVLLAAHGIILTFAAVAVMRWIARERSGEASAISLAKLAALAVCCLVACTFYAAGFTSGVLHNVGNTYLQRSVATQGSEQTPSIQVGAAALEGASELTPWGVPLRLHRTSALVNSLKLAASPDEQAATRSQITRALDDIFRIEPYFVNTLEWRNFSSTFAQLLK